jgi:hypothetical protein
MAITKKEYAAFQKAYDYYNRELFAGKLPACLITLTVKNTGDSFTENASPIEGMRVKQMN